MLLSHFLWSNLFNYKLIGQTRVDFVLFDGLLCFSICDEPKLDKIPICQTIHKVCHSVCSVVLCFFSDLWLLNVNNVSWDATAMRIGCVHYVGVQGKFGYQIKRKDKHILRFRFFCSSLCLNH